MWRLIADSREPRARSPTCAGSRPARCSRFRRSTSLALGEDRCGDDAPRAIPIYEGQDFYVPTFEVKLDGRPPGQDVIRDILSVTYKDNLQEIDSFEITINNWDADDARVQVQRRAICSIPGKQLELCDGLLGGRAAH